MNGICYESHRCRRPRSSRLRATASGGRGRIHRRAPLPALHDGRLRTLRPERGGRVRLGVGQVEVDRDERRLREATAPTRAQRPRQSRVRPNPKRMSSQMVQLHQVVITPPRWCPHCERPPRGGALQADGTQGWGRCGARATQVRGYAVRASCGTRCGARASLGDALLRSAGAERWPAREWLGSDYTRVYRPCLETRLPAC